MAEPVTEIDVVVGSMITMRPDEDRAAFEEEYADVQDVQEFLAEEGIEVDLLSQPGTEIWEGGIEREEDLYQLKRLAAHLERGKVPSTTPSADMDGEQIDEVLAAIWDGEATTRFPHLINHVVRTDQGESGYYLPVDFAEPILLSNSDEGDEFQEDDLIISFGSSVGLLRELTELEQLLRQHNVAARGPAQVLQVLKTAAQQSIDNGLPIILW